MFSSLITIALVVGCGETDTAEFQEFTHISETTSETSKDVSDPASNTSASHDEASNQDPSVPEKTAVTAQANPATDTPEQTANTSPAESQNETSTNPESSSAAVKVSLNNTQADNDTTTTADASNSSPKTTEKKTSELEKKASSPREVKLLVKERVFRKEGPQNALRASYDDIDLLKVLNMEPVTTNAAELMPDWLKGLNGKRIRIRGFMYPPFEESGIRAFVLARDNQICCFGRNPKIYDLIEINMREGKTTNYIQNRPFDVVGVFHISPAVDEGELYQLYQIDDAVVIEK